MKALVRIVTLVSVTVTWAPAVSRAVPTVSLGGPPWDQSAPGNIAPRSPSHQPSPLTLEQRADIFMVRKNYTEAADYYHQAIKQSSVADAKLWNKLGIAFQEAGNFHNAHRAYGEATRVDGSFADAWNNQATVFYMEKKYARSVKYYQRAIRLKRNDASYHMNLGTSYFYLKRFNHAVEEYRIAVSIDPHVRSHVSKLGTVVYAGSADVEYYFCLAKAFASIGNATEAVLYLRHALEDGLRDPGRIDHDPDFKKISQSPEFVELMHNPPVAIKN